MLVVSFNFRALVWGLATRSLRYRYRHSNEMVE